jgi:putative SOS response-associated peptidase YedK
MSAPIVRTAPDGERELTMMRWGFQPPPNLGTVPVTNVRNLKSPYWRGWLKAEWRCLVPATSFCEWTDSRPKVTHWFAIDESRPLFAFAGIWRLWTGERKRGDGRTPTLPPIEPNEQNTVDPTQMHSAWGALPQDIELMPQNKDYGFQPLPRFEAVTLTYEKTVNRA